MAQEIHITVPKGAKVVIHEEGEPEVERSLEERLDDLLKRLEALPAPAFVPMPYPMPYPVPTPPSELLRPYRYTVGDMPWTGTVTSSVGNSNTLALSSQ